MNIAKAGASLLFAVASSVSYAAPIQWTGPGANGHWYEAVLATKDWTQADADATARGGYLATIATQAENDFAFNLAKGNASFWFIDGANNTQGPWLGGLQPAGSAEPSGGWSWVTGESWSFTAWNAGEPNNVNGVENRLQFFGTGTSLPTIAQWNDIYLNNSAVRGYIVEFNTAPIPEPESYALLLAGLGMLGFFARRKKPAGA